MKPLWPHQISAIAGVQSAIKDGERCIILVCPTGGGKTRIDCELIKLWNEECLKTSIYTNRRLLIEQLQGVLKDFGIEFGVRAAGHASEKYLDVQLSSAQTEHSRVTRKGYWQVHAADRVIVDEAHLQTSPSFQKLIKKHLEQGAVVLGQTATPLSLAGMYDYMIQAGTMRELRKCGAIVPAIHYGPDEPDLRHIGHVTLGDDLTEKQNVKAIMTPTIFGRVWNWWRKLNPDSKPTILFGPGVGESIWFAEQFYGKGIKAAFIGGENVWLNGHYYKSSPEARKDVLDGSRDGSIPIVCNRFVLREGIDMPWLAHGIMATVFGSLESYLQSGGRLLRAFPGLENVVIQDHGGNWWRHGSLNEQRDWRIGDTARHLAAERAEGFRNKKDDGPDEPVVCPRCGLILARAECPCGFVVDPSRKVRPVIEKDGTYKLMEGDIFQPRKVSSDPTAADKWEKVYWRCKKTGKTFRQAEALFAKENNWEYPPRDLPLMPKEENDWFRRVAEVPYEELYPKV